MDRFKNLPSRLKNILPRGIAIFNKNNMSVYSGYATLFIVTAVFPFVMLIISVVNLLPGYSTKDVAEILFQILPDLGPIKELVETMMSHLKSQSGGLLASAAAVTTLWAASKGVSAIQNGLNELDDDEDSKAKKKEGGGIKRTAAGYAKNTMKQLLFTLLLVILIPALLVFQMLGGSIMDVIRAAIEKVAPDGLNSILSNVDSFFQVSSLVVVLFALLVILLIYAHLPDVHRTLKSQLPGALCTGVCWFAFTKLFSFFIPRFYHASSLYGSLASLFLLLLWLRFMVMILFAGGVLNHAIEEEKQGNQESSEAEHIGTAISGQ